jgi:hypothetical protein
LLTGIESALNIDMAVRELVTSVVQEFVKQTWLGLAVWLLSSSIVWVSFPGRGFCFQFHFCLLSLLVIIHHCVRGWL